MSPAPMPADERERLAALRSLEILDTPPEEDFDRITRLACRLLGVPMAAVSLVDADRQWFKSAQGVGESQTARADAFCGYTILHESPFVVEDAARSSLMAGSRLVTDGPRIRFYAGIPLTVNEKRVGALCVMDSAPRVATPEQIAMLEDLAGLAISLLKQRLLSREAQEASRAKSAFLSNMGHELRTPLTAVLGYGELLQEETGLNEETRAAVDAIARGARRLREMVDSVLDLTGLESGMLRPEPSRTDAVAVLDEVMAQWRPVAAERELMLGRAWRTLPPERFMTDPAKFRQALTAVVHNAVRFTSRGGVCIRGDYDAASDVVSIEVEDSGPGIEPGAMARLFEAFTQGDPSASRRHQGMGIGLALSRRLMRLLGGDVVIRSVPGQGTTVRLSVPSFSEDGEKGTRVESLSGRRVLIAEDIEENRYLIQEMLGRAGARVTACRDGVEAVSAVVGGPAGGIGGFDAVVLDMHMPRLNGLEAAKAIRHAGYEGFITMLSAMPGAIDRREGFAAGCDAFLTKPITSEALTHAIRRGIALKARGQTAHEAAC